MLLSRRCEYSIPFIGKKCFDLRNRVFEEIK